MTQGSLPIGDPLDTPNLGATCERCGAINKSLPPTADHLCAGCLAAETERTMQPPAQPPQPASSAATPPAVKPAGGGVMVKYEKPLNLPPGTAKNAARLLAAYSNHITKRVPPWTGASGITIVQSGISYLRKHPKVMLECTAASILDTVEASASLALSFNETLGHAYMVPFRNKDTNTTEAKLMVGYRGLLDLVHRAADVESVEAHLVYEGEEFREVRGTNPSLTHIPNYSTEIKRDDEHITHAYAIATFNSSGRKYWVTMTLKEIQGIRARSKQPNGDAWKYSFGEMARKTVIRRLIKYLPISVEKSALLQKAIAYEDQVFGLDMTGGEHEDPVARAERTREAMRGRGASVGQRHAGNEDVIDIAEESGEDSSA
jgi:recombination protein RecT